MLCTGYVHHLPSVYKLPSASSVFLLSSFTLSSTLPAPGLYTNAQCVCFLRLDILIFLDSYYIMVAYVGVLHQASASIFFVPD